MNIKVLIMEKYNLKFDIYVSVTSLRLNDSAFAGKDKIERRRH